MKKPLKSRRIASNFADELRYHPGGDIRLWAKLSKFDKSKKSPVTITKSIIYKGHFVGLTKRVFLRIWTSQ